MPGGRVQAGQARRAWGKPQRQTRGCFTHPLFPFPGQARWWEWQGAGSPAGPVRSPAHRLKPCCRDAWPRWGSSPTGETAPFLPGTGPCLLSPVLLPLTPGQHPDGWIWPGWPLPRLVWGWQRPFPSCLASPFDPLPSPPPRTQPRGTLHGCPASHPGAVPAPWWPPADSARRGTPVLGHGPQALLCLQSPAGTVGEMKAGPREAGQAWQLRR